MSDSPKSNRSLFVAALAAIGASACCIGPLLLLSLGISGAWIGTLTAMEPYSAYFSVATLLILAMVFRQLYLVPQRCEQDTVCANPNVQRNQRILFWIISAVLMAMITFPYYAIYVID
jgi:mercuric ion transport protein